MTRSSLALLVLLTACSGDPDDSTGTGGSAGTSSSGGLGGGGGLGGSGGASEPAWTSAPPLPEPVTNNAVAAVATPEGCLLLSAYGLDASLASPGIHPRSWARLEGDSTWTALADVPSTPGRIAASAVGLAGRVYVLGGYSVAGTGSETSHADVSVYDPATGSWSSAAPLPVPIDDAVALAWRDRYIVVVSGWADIQAPVDTVQIYDAQTDSWAMGTPFPGTPVFGHAGALDGDTLVIVDGVEGSAFDLVNQAWRGQLDPNAPGTIAWDDLGGHPPPARYRAAAAAHEGELVFHGGTDVPYNFDGLAYAGGAPAPPLASTLAWDLTTEAFRASVIDDKPTPTMDHRALVGCPDGGLHTLGGMDAGPATSAAVWRWGR